MQLEGQLYPIGSRWLQPGSTQNFDDHPYNFYVPPRGAGGGGCFSVRVLLGRYQLGGGAHFNPHPNKIMFNPIVPG